MIPIDFVHAPTAVRPSRKAPPNAWAAYRKEQKEKNISRVGRQRLERLRQPLHSERPLWVAVDGRFPNAPVLRRLPPHTTRIGRIRSDAQLYQLPERPADTAVGRRRAYGTRRSTPEALRQDESGPWQRVSTFATGKVHPFRIKTGAPVRWRTAGPKQDLRLIVLAPLGYRLRKKSRMLYRKPAYLICSDPDLPLENVAQVYLWRWYIEVNFRDEKTLLGVGQAQVRHEQSVENVPALTVAAYALLVLAAMQTFGPDGKPEVLPPPAWRQPATTSRASAASLINHLRHDLWSDALHSPNFSGFLSPHPLTHKPEKLLPQLDFAVFYAIAG